MFLGRRRQLFFSCAILIISMCTIQSLIIVSPAARRPASSLLRRRSMSTTTSKPVAPSFGVPSTSSSTSTTNSRATSRRSMVVSAYDLASQGLATNNNLVLDPLIVCGPSGVGKGTIIERFMKEHGGQDQFAFSVSHTTRSPRPGEVHGQHYHFVSVPEMKALLANNSFLESAQVHGNYYGTSWMTLRTIQQQGKRCLLDIDVQGVQNIKQLQQQDMASMFRPKYVFIAPPSMETLEERLLGRGTESAETLQRRVANAVKEVEYGTKTGNFDAVIVNNNLDVAVQEFVQVVRDLYS